MTIVNFPSEEVYVVLGIDAYGHDQVLSVCNTYDNAKEFCIKLGFETEYYDLWIEKHAVI